MTQMQKNAKTQKMQKKHKKHKKHYTNEEFLQIRKKRKTEILTFCVITFETNII